MNRYTKADIEEIRRGIEWKANLYALAAEILRDSEFGDPMCQRIVARVGLADPLRLVQPFTEDSQ